MDHPDPQPRRAKRLLIFASALLCAVAGFAFVWRGPLYAALKTWRAESFAAQALAALNRNQPVQAFEKAAAAYRLAPASPKVLKASATILASRGDPSANTFWIALAETDPSAENLAEGCRAALTLRDFHRATAFLNSLEASSAPRGLVEELRAAIALAEGQPGRAASILLALGKESGLSPSTALALSTMLRSAPDTSPEQLREDRERLKTIAASETREALTALLLLAAELPQGDPDRAALAARLREHPMAGASHKLLADQIRLAGDPRGILAAREEILAEAAGWPPEEVAAAASWLLAHGAAGLAADLIPAEKAPERRDLMTLRLRALEASGQFAAMDKELRRASLPISEPERYLGLALASAADDRPTAADAYWKRAITTAKNDPATLLGLAARAEAAGWFEKAEALYETLASDPVATAPAFEGLVRLADRRGLAETLPVLERSYFAQPGSEGVLVSLLYAKLLLRKHSPEDVETAAALALKNRSMPACRVVLALAFLRENDPANALSALEDLRLDWSREQPAKTAVYAAALAANGRPEDARALVAGIGHRNFRPEELDLIREFLGRE